MKTQIFIAISFLYSMSVFSQDIESVRYKVSYNSMLDLIEKYPEKKESIEKRIKSETMQYVDFILIENDLIQIYWGFDNSLMGVVIYSKNKFYRLSKENELTEGIFNPEKDSVIYKKNKITNDSLCRYELSEKNAMPLVITLKNSLMADSFKRESIINDYPEIGFILDFRIFPEKMVFGKPKAFMTFEFLEVLKTSPIESKEVYLELLSNIKSKKKRKEILIKIAERKLVRHIPASSNTTKDNGD